MTAEAAQSYTSSNFLSHSAPSKYSQHHTFNQAQISCRSIDEHALLAQDGGFRYGGITAIEGGKACGKTLIAMHTITSHLIDNLESQVAWVDTTNNFSAARLLSVVKQRLRPPPGATHEEVGDGFGYYEKVQRDDAGAAEEAVVKPEQLLERVQVMRVFDIHGVIEALEEIIAGFQKLDDERDAAEFKMREEVEKAELERQHAEMAIADSEGEDEDDIAISPIAIAEETMQVPATEAMIANRVMSKGIGVLVIDTISNPISTLLEKGEIEGNALLSSLSRSLTSLAKTRNLAILLLSATSPPPTNRMHKQSFSSYASQFTATSNASIFSSLPAYLSGMGLVMSNTSDLTVLVSRFPSARDIWKIHGKATQAFKPKKGEDENQEVFVFEVLVDRKGEGVGRWALFGIEEGVKLMDVID